MIKHLCVLCLIAPLATAVAAQEATTERQTRGDILLIEKVRERMARDLPRNGLSMTEVERRFGAPLERRPAVGEPPITRWVFEDYSVFFEHQLVIESVLHDEAIRREMQAGR
ncbi:MAG: hypothetical protein ACXIUM_11345 [Wenzhouxiangella sp.]